jgi:hypothetical protein
MWFLKSSVTSLIAAGIIPENERASNNVKEVKVRPENKAEYEAYHYIRRFVKSINYESQAYRLVDFLKGNIDGFRLKRCFHSKGNSGDDLCVLGACGKGRYSH